MRRLLILLLLAGIFYIYCEKECLCGTSLMGIWKSSDGAIIELRNDGTCRVVGINFNRFLTCDSYGHGGTNLNGIWDYKECFKDIHHQVADPDILQLLVWDKRDKVKYNFLFSVCGDIYPWEKRDSLSIFVCTKSQDDKDLYEFKRQWSKGGNENKILGDFAEIFIWIGKLKKKLYNLKYLDLQKKLRVQLNEIFCKDNVHEKTDSLSVL